MLHALHWSVLYLMGVLRGEEFAEEQSINLYVDVNNC